MLHYGDRNITGQSILLAIVAILLASWPTLEHEKHEGEILRRLH